MTDNQFSNLLSLFHEIEKLMVKNGAPLTKDDNLPTSFSDKVKSFDNFGAQPSNPGEVGHKFYFKYGSYYIKDIYEDDEGIDDELEEYERYKSYKKRYWEYKNTVLHGHYSTLIRIGHERNQLLHIFEYKIDNYRKFVKVCNSMIKYLSDPEKVPFFAYKNLNSKTENKKLSTVKQTSIVSHFIHKFKSMVSGLFNTSINFVSKLIYILLIIIGLLLLAGIIKFLVVLWANTTLLMFFVFVIGGVVVSAIYEGGPLILAALYGLFLLYHDSHIADIFNKDKKTVHQIVKKKTVVENQVSDILTKNESKKEKKLYKIDKKQIVEKTLPEPQSCSYYYVQSKTLNVRSDSRATSNVVDKLQLNQKICITKKENPWYYILNKGWVHSKYISVEKANIKEKKKPVKKKRYVWHCSARSERASGWVEKIGKKNAINGALRQCELRRVNTKKCVIDDCYQVR